MVDQVMDDVVQSSADDIEYLIDVFMPDGKPFGMEKQSEEDQLNRYLAEGLHDDPEAAKNWIRKRVGELVQLMRTFGVPGEQMKAVHPYDIVQTAAIVWSNHMESLLRERKSRIAPAEEVAPSVPVTPGGDAWPKSIVPASA